MRFSGLQKKIKLWLRKFILKLKSRIITVTFYSYDTLTLKLFIKINDTGNVNLLIKSGFATPDLCAERWEMIVAANNKALGRNDYNAFLTLYKQYARLLSDFNAIKASIIILLHCIDYEAVQYMRSKGYKILLTNSKLYAQSLAAAVRKSDNLLTKLKMKKNELLELMPRNVKTESFEAIMAALTFSLGYTVADDLTLARYNEYLKLIERKQKAIKAAQQKQRNG